MFGFLWYSPLLPLLETQPTVASRGSTFLLQHPESCQKGVQLLAILLNLSVLGQELAPPFVLRTTESIPMTTICINLLEHTSNGWAPVLAPSLPPSPQVL